MCKDCKFRSVSYANDWKVAISSIIASLAILCVDVSFIVVVTCYLFCTLPSITKNYLKIYTGIESGIFQRFQHKFLLVFYENTLANVTKMSSMFLQNAAAFQTFLYEGYKVLHNEQSCRV